MRFMLIAMLLLAFSFVACDKEHEGRSGKLEGVYTGKFSRKLSGSGPSSNVTLNFANGTWSGSSDSIYYPALCSGTFTISGNKVTFRNGCAWVASFDWTFILDGEYDLHFSDSSTVRLKRTTGKGVDTYELHK